MAPVESLHIHHTMGDETAAGWGDLFAAAAGQQAKVKTSGETLSQPFLCDSDRSSLKEKRAHSAHYKVQGGRIKKRKKNKRAGRVNLDSRRQDDLRRVMIESRVEALPPKWPEWLRLGSSLLIGSGMGKSPSCSSWSAGNMKLAADGGEVEPTSLTKLWICKNCNMSPMHHSALVDFSNDSTNRAASLLFQMFVLIRDVRCCCGCAADLGENGTFSLTKGWGKFSLQQQWGYSRTARDISRRLVSLFSSAETTLPPGERSIVEEKCALLLNAAERWYGRAKGCVKMYHVGTKSLKDESFRKIKELGTNSQRVSSLEAFEEAVRLRNACDAVYYRVYYIQVTGGIPVSYLSNYGPAFIPHPTTYFGTPYLSWDVKVGQACMVNFLQSVLPNIQDETSQRRDSAGAPQIDLIRTVLIRHGISPCIFPLSAGQPGKSDTRKINRSVDVAVNSNEHPLSFLHCNRFMETVLLFWKSGWTDLQQVLSQQMHALSRRQYQTQDHKDYDRFHARHETPAPFSLMEWRDSSRDLLCNLYAYAALSHGTVTQIKSVLDNENIVHGVVEIGAGTGYVARSFKDSGLQVVAMDIAPAASNLVMNEYHGATPPFIAVDKGDVNALNQYYSHESSSKVSNSALLLCYPPPQSSMARDALRIHMSWGGRCVIHIGEFCGLTGCIEFENLLIGNFKCVARIPCLEWGTDAADVTIWIRKETLNPHKLTTSSSEPRTHFLIPCSNCKEAASRRCRLVRSLAYCSATCYQRHEFARNVHFAMNMIPMGYLPEFTNDDHFDSIAAFGTSSALSTSKRKKRNRNKGKYHNQDAEV